MLEEHMRRWSMVLVAASACGRLGFDGHTRVGGSTNFSLVVDNLDRTYAEPREAGVEFAGPPTKQEWGAFAILIDSEGNKLLIKGDGR